MPSLIGENLRHAAIDRARDYLRSASQPVLVFIEDTKDPKYAEPTMLIDLGDETARQARLTDKTTGDDEEGDNDEETVSHIFMSGDIEKPSSKSDETIKAMRTEITMLRTGYEQANQKAMLQEKLIEDITLVSEQNESKLERELRERSEEIQLLTEENRKNETLHLMRMKQLETDIQRMKGENLNLINLIKKVNIHERDVSLCKNKLEQVQPLSSQQPLASSHDLSRRIEVIDDGRSSISPHESAIKSPSSMSLKLEATSEEADEEYDVPVASSHRLSHHTTWVQPTVYQPNQHANVNHTLQRSFRNLGNRLASQRYDEKKLSGQVLHRRVRILQPKDFGLTQWKPHETDIATHLELVADCVKEARLIGATEPNLIRLLMRTMPENYKFLSEFINPNMSTTYEDFAGEVARILSKRAPVQMASFLQATRKPEEHLLEYFYRIAIMYKASNGLTGNKWQSNSSHVIAILAKLLESLNNGSKVELTRRLEPHIEAGNLTIDKLKTHLVEVSKLLRTKQQLRNETEYDGSEKLEYDQNSNSPIESRGYEKPGCWNGCAPAWGRFSNREAGKRKIQYIEEDKAMSYDYAG